MKTLTNYFYAIMAGTILLYSCSNDDGGDPEIPNEEEVITTVIAEFEDAAGGDIDFTFRDLDGDGGTAPVYTTEALAANTTYTVHLDILNELAEEEEGEDHDEDEEEGHSHSHGEDVTTEIREEADEHQVFYFISDANATAAYNDDDVDSNGLPVGLEATITTGDASTGKLRIVLRHEPKKPNDGTLADAGGETDFDIEFDLVIE